MQGHPERSGNTGTVGSQGHLICLPRPPPSLYLLPADKARLASLRPEQDGAGYMRCGGWREDIRHSKDFLNKRGAPSVTKCQWNVSESVALELRLLGCPSTASAIPFPW